LNLVHHGLQTVETTQTKKSKNNEKRGPEKGRKRFPLYVNRFTKPREKNIKHGPEKRKNERGKGEKSKQGKRAKG